MSSLHAFYECISQMYTANGIVYVEFSNSLRGENSVKQNAKWNTKHAK